MTRISGLILALLSTSPMVNAASAAAATDPAGKALVGKLPVVMQNVMNEMQGYLT